MSEPRSHDELASLLGAFALDALEPDEAEAVELHLRDCPRCRAEVTDHREVAALLAHTGAPAPDGVWDRIVDVLDSGGGAPPALRLPPGPTSVPAVAGGNDAPLVPVTPLVRSRPWGQRAVAGVAGLAAAVAAVLGVVVVRQDDRLDELDESLASVSLDQLASTAMADPDAVRADLRSADGSMSAPAVLEDDGAGFLVAHGLPDLAENRTYQLWGVVGDGMISLGTFDGDATVVPFRVDPSVSSFSVTEEVAGGVEVSQEAALLTGATS